MLRREQLIGAGLLSALMAFVGMSYGADQPSVAHAALNVINNRSSIGREFNQTIPDPTDTPTTEAATPTPTVSTPTPEAPTATATSEQQADVTATPTPAEPTATPTVDHSQDTYSIISVTVYDRNNQPVADEPITIHKEDPQQDSMSTTGIEGSVSEAFLDGQTASLSTTGPNMVEKAVYTVDTNNQLFNKIVLTHEEGEHLTSSVEVSTTHQSALQLRGAGAYDDEPTATPAATATEEPTATQAPTQNPESTATTAPTETPDLTPTPIITPTPDQSSPTPLPINLDISGVVLSDTIGLNSSPDGTHVEVSDFETSGELSLSSNELVGAAEATSLATADYDITVAATTGDADGFTLSVGFADGTTTKSFISPDSFSSGSISLNTREVAAAIEQSHGADVNIPIAIDTNGDGSPDTHTQLPAEIEKPVEEKNYLYFPLIVTP